jgi:hypothetical protein
MTHGHIPVQKARRDMGSPGIRTSPFPIGRPDAQKKVVISPMN